MFLIHYVNTGIKVDDTENIEKLIKILENLRNSLVFLICNSLFVNKDKFIAFAIIQNLTSNQKNFKMME